MQDFCGEEELLEAVFINTHGPDVPAVVGASSARRGLEAATALNFDLRSSLLVGDNLSNLKTGVATGLAIFFIC